jgi:alpha-L-fucosidase
MWGEYSVPAFADTDFYSEWYEFCLKADEKIISSEIDGHLFFEEGSQNTSMNPEDMRRHFRKQSAAVKAFHEKAYGANFRFENFYDMFKGELFDATEWADTLSEAGIRYIALSAKHHGGFCMFPSEHEKASWGYYKDSVHLGPRRDVLGEVFAAMRKRGIRPGIYYTMYEWFNPLWVSDRSLYVEKVTLPQLTEIVTKYKPELIWNDGEWLMDYRGWRSEEFLAWLFNDSPVRDDIVVNDRWGGVNGRYGSYFTTEYGGGFKGIDKPWEENHGVDSSYGYKRNSTVAQHKSPVRLVHTLIDIVSRGGNYLLNVPPRADGRIPNLITERLLQIGRWLKVNGEAIYGTRASTAPYQWSSREPYEIDYGKSLSFDTGGFDITEYTTQPRRKDHPRIEAFFTTKPGVLYAILPAWPRDRFVVRDLVLGSNARVTLLGLEGSLKWEQSGKDAAVTIPRIYPDEMPCEHAWTLKIETGRS